MAFRGPGVIFAGDIVKLKENYKELMEIYKNEYYHCSGSDEHFGVFNLALEDDTLKDKEWIVIHKIEGCISIQNKKNESEYFSYCNPDFFEIVREAPIEAEIKPGMYIYSKKNPKIRGCVTKINRPRKDGDFTCKVDNKHLILNSDAVRITHRDFFTKPKTELSVGAKKLLKRILEDVPCFYDITPDDETLLKRIEEYSK